MKQVILNNGLKMPYLGLGVFQLIQSDDAYRAVRSALDLGYRYVDTTMIYGNESAVGKAIRDSGVPREDIFLASKFWTTVGINKNVKNAYESSLKELKVDYLDLYLVHWPVREHYLSVWNEMEALYKAGRVRAIGVVNFEIPLLKELLTVCSVRPMVSQFELHPYLPQKKMIDYCKMYQIQTVAYSPLCATKSDLIENKELVKLAEKYSKSVAQIILRWNIEREVVVLPKSFNKTRQKENINIFDFSLNIDEVDVITQLNREMRLEDFSENLPFVYL